MEQQRPCRKQVQTLSKQKRTDPVKVMLVWTLILAILTVGVNIFNRAITAYRVEKLNAEREAINAENELLQQAYMLELADYEAQVQAQEAIQWPEHGTEGWEILDLSEYPLENRQTVSVSRADVMNNGLLLVNPWHSRPDDFSEAELVSIGQNAHKKVGVQNYDQKLFPEAVQALVAAMTDAEALGLKHYVIKDAYRSYDDQANLFNEALETYSSRYEGDALIARAKRDVNYPGTSEFNTGLAFTLYLYSSEDRSVNDLKFSTSPQGTWLYENCWKYGLIFRFPTQDFPVRNVADKSYKTGVSIQLNCYRYVGKAHAAVMHQLGLCLEEYIEYLQEHPHFAVYEDGVLKYEIVRQEVGEDANSFYVDITRNAPAYTMSLDNMGGVVTVFEY